MMWSSVRESIGISGRNYRYKMGMHPWRSSWTQLLQMRLKDTSVTATTIRVALSFRWGDLFLGRVLAALVEAISQNGHASVKVQMEPAITDEIVMRTCCKWHWFVYMKGQWCRKIINVGSLQKCQCLMVQLVIVQYWNFDISIFYSPVLLVEEMTDGINDSVKMPWRSLS